MKRRTVLGAGLGGIAVAAAPAVAQSGQTLTMVTDRPSAAQALANRVALVSNGQLRIEVQAAGSDTAAGFLGLVSSGSADMYMTSDEAFVAENMAFGLFSAMPGGMSSSELESWILVSDGRFMWDILGEEYGVKSFMVGDDGPLPIWSKEPLSGLGSLSSGPVGSCGLGVHAMRGLGATDVVDIQTSGVDLSSLVAFEGLSVSAMSDAGLLDVFPHMTAPNAGRPSSFQSAGMNLSRWSELTPTDQLIIERCIMAEHGLNRALATHRNVVSLRDAGAGVTTHEMPQEIWDAQIAASNSVMIEIIESGDLGADIGDAYLYFIGDVAGWSEIGETAYFLGRKQALSL